MIDRNSCSRGTQPFEIRYLSAVVTGTVPTLPYRGREYYALNCASIAGLRIRITLLLIRIHLFTIMRTRILLLIRVMTICDHWSMDPLGLQIQISGSSVQK
jgi:hypothetical protein